jgi:hypothetical protein
MIPVFVAVQDFNGDAKQDPVIANFTTNTAASVL